MCRVVKQVGELGYENNIGTLKLSGILLRSPYTQGGKYGNQEHFGLSFFFFCFVFYFLRIIEPGLLGSSMRRAGP